MLRRYVVAAAAVRTCSVLQEVFLCLQFVLQALQQSDSPGPDLEPCSNSCSAAGFHTALCYVTAARRSSTAGEVMMVAVEVGQGTFAHIIVITAYRLASL